MKIEETATVNLRDESEELWAFWAGGRFIMILHAGLGNSLPVAASLSPEEARAFNAALESPAQSLEDLGLSEVLGGKLRIIETNRGEPYRHGIELQIIASHELGAHNPSIFIEEFNIDAVRIVIASGLEDNTPDALAP